MLWFVNRPDLTAAVSRLDAAAALHARCTLHGGTRVAGPTSRIEAGMYTVSIGRRPVAVLHSVGGQRGCVGTCRVALPVATYVYRRLSAATGGTASQKAARSVSLTKT